MRLTPPGQGGRIAPDGCGAFWVSASLQGTGGSFSIDSEEYEAMPVEVKLLPRKLHFFCDPRKRAQMLQSAAPWVGTRSQALGDWDQKGAPASPVPSVVRGSRGRLHGKYPFSQRSPFSACSLLACQWSLPSASFPQTSSRSLPLTDFITPKCSHSKKQAPPLHSPPTAPPWPS